MDLRKNKFCEVGLTFQTLITVLSYEIFAHQYH